jgi:hypothetical protein
VIRSASREEREWGIFSQTLRFESAYGIRGYFLGVAIKESGSISQLIFTRLANHAIGFRSMPMLAMHSFLHWTSVVPVPQNGSKTVVAGDRLNCCAYFLIRYGGYDRTKRYQSCPGRSSARTYCLLELFPQQPRPRPRKVTFEGPRPSSRASVSPNRSR